MDLAAVSAGSHINFQLSRLSGFSLGAFNTDNGLFRSCRTSFAVRSAITATAELLFGYTSYTRTFLVSYEKRLVFIHAETAKRMIE